ncbi:hypothetical protein AC578_4223 [Pseudocercospora eumusae]|uniref:Uncharacterized protein n=1 Tax=Pseudocercospora eumusae TaxID=321146 RepID=A0A139H3C9_9PEZI|nr:hypothetical protein AC578_4223 [Pseudocercospora eumusae]
MSSSSPLPSSPSQTVRGDHILPPSPPLSPKQLTSSPGEGEDDTDTATARTRTRTASPAPPAPADRLFDILHSLYRGQLVPASESCLHRQQLAPAEWDLVEARLKKDHALDAWFQDKVRFDYDGCDFLLRMPHAIHEQFVESLKKSIGDGLKRLAETLRDDGHCELADHVGKVYGGGSTTLEIKVPQLAEGTQKRLVGAIMKKSPDAIFHCDSSDDKASILPPLVVEVSYSQEPKELSELAEDYIVDSNHKIRCVLGLDVTYHDPSKREQRKKKMGTQAAEDLTATVSVWRAHLDAERIGSCRCDMDAVQFRNKDGSACEGNLELSVADLLSPPLLYKFAADIDALRSKHITIPFGHLAESLQFAERVILAPESSPEPTTLTPIGLRKRKRESSSEKVLSSDERADEAQQKNEDKRQKKDDKAWRASVAKRSNFPEGSTTGQAGRRRSQRFQQTAGID